MMMTSATMFKGHELLEKVLQAPESALYQALMQATKFDLGSGALLGQLPDRAGHATVGAPAPLGLYQADDNLLWLVREVQATGEQPKLLAVNLFIKYDLDGWRPVNARCYIGRGPAGNLVGLLRDAFDGSGNLLSPGDSTVDIEFLYLSAHSLAKVFDVLDCANVQRVKHSPAPGANAARVIQGGIAEFDYFTLHTTPDDGGPAERVDFSQGRILRMTPEISLWDSSAPPRPSDTWRM